MVHVYTKEIPKPGKKYPVLVWVHGGAFNMNFGNKNFFSPDYAMGHDIVLVAFNYRLGALGEYCRFLINFFLYFIKKKSKFGKRK